MPRLEHMQHRLRSGMQHAPLHPATVRVPSGCGSAQTTAVGRSGFQGLLGSTLPLARVESSIEGGASTRACAVGQVATARLQAELQTRRADHAARNKACERSRAVVIDGRSSAPGFSLASQLVGPVHAARPREE